MNLTNLEIAFNTKSDEELKAARFLFSIIKRPPIVAILGVLSKIALTLKIPIAWAVKPLLYKQFVGGENIEDCAPAVNKMYESKVMSILDFSIEASQSERKIVKAHNEILKSIINSQLNKGISFSVFKATSVIRPIILEKICEKRRLTDEEEDEYGDFIDRFDNLCKAAEKTGKPVLIDAEDYAYQREIDDVVEMVTAKYNINKVVVYNTLQMYRIDRLDYLKRIIEIARRDNLKLGVKLVRGAYMDQERSRAKAKGYPSPIHNTKEATDNAFNEALKILMQNLDIVDIFCGTHNEESIMILADLMKSNNLPNNYKGINFSQLYGMSDNITFNLANEGYNVSKYLPYGKVKDVLPYLIRRAQENTAIAGQTSRELEMIEEELKRRNL